jgi:hypothetical protein
MGTKVSMRTQRVINQILNIEFSIALKSNLSFFIYSTLYSNYNNYNNFHDK